MSYSSPLLKSLSLSETLLIRVSHTWKILNWLSKAMMPVSVVSSFINSYLMKSTSFELSRVTLLVTLCAAAWQSHWGILKGNWLSNQCGKLFMTQWWQDQGLLYYYFFVWTFEGLKVYSVPEVWILENFSPSLLSTLWTIASTNPSNQTTTFLLLSKFFISISIFVCHINAVMPV